MLLRFERNVFCHFDELNTDCEVPFQDPRKMEIKVTGKHVDIMPPWTFFFPNADLGSKIT